MGHRPRRDIHGLRSVMPELPFHHLEGAVADKDQCVSASGNPHAVPRWCAVSHDGIVAGRHQVGFGIGQRVAYTHALTQSTLHPQTRRSDTLRASPLHTPSARDDDLRPARRGAPGR